MRRDAVIKSHNSQGKLQKIYTDIWIQVMAQCTSVLVRESVLSQFSFELRHDKITFVSDFPRAAADTKINKPREGRERKTESALHFRPGHLFGAEGLTVCPAVCPLVSLTARPLALPLVCMQNKYALPARPWRTCLAKVAHKRSYFLDQKRRKKAKAKGKGKGTRGRSRRTSQEHLK